MKNDLHCGCDCRHNACSFLLQTTHEIEELLGKLENRIAGYEKLSERNYDDLLDEIERATNREDIIEKLVTGGVSLADYYTKREINRMIANLITGSSGEGTPDKPYDPSTNNGLGRKTFKIKDGDNKLTQSDFNLSNTIYVVASDFDLAGESINIPSGSILDFEGGSLSNGNLVGNDTQIRADKAPIFTGITIEGTWNVPYITTKWFSDAEQTNMLVQVLNLCSPDMQNFVQIEQGTFYVATYEENKAALAPVSNTTINIAGTILMETNAFARYRMFSIAGQHNITIEGNGYLLGDALTHEYDKYAETLGNKIICTNAANTPKDKTLYVNGETAIVGTLEPSANLVGNCYWIRGNYADNTAYKYTYYIVVEENGEYVFDKVGTLEWGLGIRVTTSDGDTSSDVIIRGLHIKYFTGDGLSMSGLNTIVENVTIEKCRRQGITVGPASNLVIRNFVISDIGSFTEGDIAVVGTNPRSAIDIEPSRGNSPATNVLIDNGIVSNCQHVVESQGADRSSRTLIVRNITAENITRTAFICTYAKKAIYENIITNNTHTVFNLKHNDSVSVTNAFCTNCVSGYGLFVSSTNNKVIVNNFNAQCPKLTIGKTILNNSNIQCSGTFKLGSCTINNSTIQSTSDTQIKGYTNITNSTISARTLRIYSDTVIDNCILECSSVGSNNFIRYRNKLDIRNSKINGLNKRCIFVLTSLGPNNLPQLSLKNCELETTLDGVSSSRYIIYNAKRQVNETDDSEADDQVETNPTLDPNTYDDPYDYDADLENNTEDLQDESSQSSIRPDRLEYEDVMENVVFRMTGTGTYRQALWGTLINPVVYEMRDGIEVTSKPTRGSGHVNIIYTKLKYTWGNERPTDYMSHGTVGHRFFDTTLGKPIYWDKEKWVDATGAAV